MNDDTDKVKQASLLQLAQYLVAVDGTHVAEGDPRKTFGLVQQYCSLMLLDALREYRFGFKAIEGVAE